MYKLSCASSDYMALNRHANPPPIDALVCVCTGEREKVLVVIIHCREIDIFGNGKRKMTT